MVLFNFTDCGDCFNHRSVCGRPLRCDLFTQSRWRSHDGAGCLISWQCHHVQQSGLQGAAQSQRRLGDGCLRKTVQWNPEWSGNGGQCGLHEHHGHQRLQWVHPRLGDPIATAFEPEKTETPAGSNVGHSKSRLFRIRKFATDAAKRKC